MNRFVAGMMLTLCILWLTGTPHIHWWIVLAPIYLPVLILGAASLVATAVSVAAEACERLRRPRPYRLPLSLWPTYSRWKNAGVG